MLVCPNSDSRFSSTESVPRCWFSAKCVKCGILGFERKTFQLKNFQAKWTYEFQFEIASMLDFEVRWIQQIGYLEVSG